MELDTATTCKKQPRKEPPACEAAFTTPTPEADSRQRGWEEGCEVLSTLPARFRSFHEVRQAVVCPPCACQRLSSHHRSREGHRGGCIMSIPQFFRERHRPRGGQGCGMCGRGLHAALRRAVENARNSIGAVDPINPDSTTLVAIVCPLAEGDEVEDGTANRKRPRRSAAATAPLGRFGVAGVCLATAQERVYRAHREKQTCTAATALAAGPSAGGGNDGGIPLSFTAASAPAPASAEGAQVRAVGDVWCTGTIFCGVQLFYVHERFRRCGLATTLVDMARRTVCYGYEVPAAHVAFSEPTPLGSRFAARYSGRDDFLVY